MSGHVDRFDRERLEELSTRLRDATVAALANRSTLARALDESRGDVERLLMLSAMDSVEYGAEAIAHLVAVDHGIGLILLDLMMPNVDGWAFRRLPLADPATAAIPVVIMSAVHDVRAAAASLSVPDFLIKPIALPALMNIVQRYCDP